MAGVLLPTCGNKKYWFHNYEFVKEDMCVIQILELLAPIISLKTFPELNNQKPVFFIDNNGAQSTCASGCSGHELYVPAATELWDLLAKERIKPW